MPIRGAVDFLGGIDIDDYAYNNLLKHMERMERFNSKYYIANIFMYARFVE